MHVCTYLYTNADVFSKDFQEKKKTYQHKYKRTYVYVCIYKYTHTYMFICTYAYLCTIEDGFPRDSQEMRS
jgi:hypothetical protein